MLSPGSIDLAAFTAGVGIAELTLATVWAFLIVFVLFRKLLSAAGW